MQAIRQPLIKKKEERDWQKDTFAFERRSDEMAAGFTLSMNLESFWESLSFFGVSIPFCPSSNISKSFHFFILTRVDGDAIPGPGSDPAADGASLRHPGAQAGII